MMKTQLVAKVFLITAVLLLCCQSGFVQAKHIYVDCTLANGGDGSSWATAYKYLQDALAAAVSGDSIHVAPGTYKPDQGNGLTPGDRNAAFKLKEGVSIAGLNAGYIAGKFKVILSGDLNGDDGPNFTNYADNSYNVVICDTITQGTRIAGFTITGGNAEGTYPYNRGGGMLIKSSAMVQVFNCIFSGNMAQHAGGGLYSMNGNSTLVVNCIFNGNKAQNAGGGMQDAGGSSTLIHCTFYGNVTVDNPGWGGGLRVYNSNTKMINCILWGNSAAHGNQIAVDNASTPSISYSDNQGGQAAIYIPAGDGSTITWGAGNMDADPLFEDATQGNYHLRKGSPCVDEGTPTTPVILTDDFEHSPRKSSAGGDDKPDIGADELIVREVGKSGYPYTTIQAAIYAARTGDLVLVHDGTYIENIDFWGMLIRVRSENGVEKTTIDGNQSGSVVTFNKKEGAESILDGFSIKNGNSDYGGGIFCDNSSPTITNCSITENAAFRGGGIDCKYSSPTITNCVIRGNNAQDGGGINSYISILTIVNCTLGVNSAATSNSGGGFHCQFNSQATIGNSILWGDTAAGIANEINLDDTSLLEVMYSDVQGGWLGQGGNISSNPLFKDAANGDYHLLPGSPCIDAANSDGAPTTDIKGNLRYDDPQTTNTGAGALIYYDMGAIEYQGIVATTTTTASGGGGGGGGGGTSTTTAVNTTTTTSVATTTTTSVIVTTTTTAVSSTTTTIEAECTLTVEKIFFPFNAWLFARLRRIVIKGGNSEWDRTSQVTIDDINTVFRRVKDQETIIAWIIIPGKLIAKFEPGTKPVRVQTPGKEDCTGAIVIE